MKQEIKTTEAIFPMPVLMMPFFFYNLRANTRDFSHEIQPFLHIYFTNYYNICKKVV